MTKLTRSAQTFIDEAKGGDEPTSAARARVRAKLLTRIGAGAAIGAQTTSATAAGVATKTALSAALLFKVLGVLGVAGGIAAGVIASRRGSEPEAATTSVVVTPQPRLDAAPSSSMRPPPVDSAEAPESTSTPHVAPRPSVIRTLPSSPTLVAPREASSTAIVPAQATGGSLDAEMELIRKAQTELREGHPGRALEALDAHGAEFKNGALREERLAAHILALCDLGRTDEARSEAQRFLAASPRSPMAERVRNSCGGATSK